ncbi:ABC-2 type transport system ATP-binding protein [Chitinophaga dinghuensis]|uniref:ABC-2 type transport system ATP-binding protein n=1 Tax=Chitinophaga dinghuensis TaxID=1539050 RepID=A0A327W4W1_9BACT|nr:ABC transporter ATP-binding protein [Chitinophaga dinghuensis]RAJ80008.1 ABC-2 type transport system ATP-binding protein [Chitinophaga dinghuensis]
MHISVDSVTKKYGKITVLDQVSIDFRQGGCYCIIGVNGAGKSTLFNLLMQYIKAETGEILYDTHRFQVLPAAYKQRMGYLSEPLNILEELSVNQYLDFTGKLYGVAPALLQDRKERILQFLFEDQEEIGKKRIAVLSTGMKKKVAFAGAILHSPEFLLLDEPFSALDPVSAKKICNFLSGYLNEKRTIVFSSHNLEYLEAINPIIIILDDAKVKYNAPLAEFTSNHSQSISQSLMEKLKVNDSSTVMQWD